MSGITFKIPPPNILEIILCSKHFENNPENKINEFYTNYNNDDFISDILFFIPDIIDMETFTMNIDNTMLDGSPLHFSNILWEDCNKLLSHPYKQEILLDWKYGSEFICVEKYHQNGNQSYKDFPLGASFCTELLMYIFH